MRGIQTDRQTGGGASRGRLLASVNGQQGTVCDDFATNALAMVVYRELGFNT